MKRGCVVWGLAIVLLGAGVASADMEPVKVGFGSLQLSGLFQAGFRYYIGDEYAATRDVDLNHDGEIAADGTESNIPAAMDRTSDMEFYVRRARIAFKGTIVDERVGYFFQTEFVDNESYVLDARLAFSYIPYTTISIGRFVPKFTYWAPMNKAYTYLIELPQMNDFLGVQRQTGVNVGVFHKYFEVDFGAFNGRNEPGIPINPVDRAGAPLGTNTQDVWNDENTAKDVYAAFAIKPVDGLRIFGGYWYGMPLDYFEEKDGDMVAHNAKVGIVNGGAAYLANFGLHLWGEAMYQTVRFDSSPSTDPNGERPDDTFEYSALSWYAMAGYNFKNSGVPFEVLARYDSLDPDTTNDEKTHGDKDAVTHLTAGFNYYIEDFFAVMSVNYIYKAEEVELLDKKLVEDQTGVFNDELELQMQIHF